MKYSVNGSKRYNVPVKINPIYMNTHEVAEALADLWYWNNFDSQGIQPEYYSVKTYTDDEKFISGYVVEVDYSPTFNAYMSIKGEE